MNLVTLPDGRQVDSSSEAWRAHCEAITILRMEPHKRIELFQAIEAKRGADAVQALKLLCFETEPHFVLGLPNRAQRSDYLNKVLARFGQNHHDALRAKVLALHNARQAVAGSNSDSA